MNSKQPNDLILESIVRESFLALGSCSPNPPVAAVITDENNDILLSAHTQPTGQNHAEREAYKKWDLKFHPKASIYSIADSGLPTSEKIIPHNLYVSLEPCNHFGRTPPCRDLVLEKSPKQIIVGNLDPNPLVASNRDSDIYSNKGIHWTESKELASVSAPYLQPFFTRIKNNRPKVLIKSVVSQEGNFASFTEGNLPISNPSSNRILSLLRSKVDCILVGPKTLELDQPSLNFRIPDSILKECQDFEMNERENPSFHKNFMTIGSGGNLTIPREPLSYDFWTRLIAYSDDLSIWIEANRKYIYYQPKRAFIVSASSCINPKFIQKQIEIQNSLKNWIHENRDFIRPDMTEVESLLPDVLFFILKEENSSHNDKFDTELKDLLSIPNSHLIRLTKENFASQILNYLSTLGVNFLLVEGGNLLYKEFYHILEPQDEILYIQSSNVSIPEGKSVSYAKLQNKVIYLKQIDSDIWKVLKKE